MSMCSVHLPVFVSVKVSRSNHNKGSCTRGRGTVTLKFRPNVFNNFAPDVT